MAQTLIPVAQLINGTSQGTGAIVLATSPTLTTPVLGVATATSVNGLSFTANSTGFSIAGGTTSKTVTISNTLTLAGTDSTTMTFPTVSASIPGLAVNQTWSNLQKFTNSNIAVLGSSTGYTMFSSANASATNYTLTLPAATDTLVGRATTDTLTNKRMQPRTGTTTSTSTLTFDVSSYSVYYLTAQAAALTIANPTGTPVKGEAIAIYILDNGTSQTLSWGTNFKAYGAALPTATTISKQLMVTAQYDGTNWCTLTATAQ